MKLFLLAGIALCQESGGQVDFKPADIFHPVQSVAPGTTIVPPPITRDTTPLREGDSVVDPKKYILKLGPFFRLGVQQFRKPRTVPAGARVVCPSQDYCIDHRLSDAATCMYPSLIEIKKCLDATCRQGVPNKAVAENDVSYCKEFMLMPEGRVCQWTDAPCACDKSDLTYADAVIVKPGDAAPQGWREVAGCEYPDNFKDLEYRPKDADKKLNQAPGGKAEGNGSAGAVSTAFSITLLAIITMFQ